jgi:thioredoxin-related protein
MAERSKLDTIANIAIIVVCVIAAYVLIQRYFFTPEAPPQPGQVQAGEQLDPLRDVVPAGTDRALVVALSPTCKFCTESMPFYKRLIDERNEKGSKVKVIAAVPAEEAKEAEKQTMDEAGVSPDQLVAVDFASIKVPGTPTILLVDNQGKVLDVWVGKLDSGKERDVLKKL